MAPLQKSKSAIQATDQLQIQHFTHQHILHKIYMTFEFNCDGCNTGGYGVRYRCAACDFDLHEKCASSPHRVSSHLHPHHQLVLVNRPGDTHFCNVCRGFTNGLSYTCESPTCEFDVHTLCVQTPAANGVPSMTLDHGQQAGGASWGQPATLVGGHHQRSHSQPLMFNHQYGKNEQKQMNVPTRFGGYNGVNDNSIPGMINNHQQQPQNQGMPTASFRYNEVNVSQPAMTINQHQHQPQQGVPLTVFGGYNGANNNGQPAIVNHQQLQQQQQQQKQGMYTAGFNGYNGVTNTNGQPIMMNHPQHQQQQQGMSMTAFNGYNGMNTTNQQLMINPQQQQGRPFYNGIYNNQQMMMNPQQQQQQQQQPGKTSNYSKAGKFAANILSTSLIGIPLFNSRN